MRLHALTWTGVQLFYISLSKLAPLCTKTDSPFSTTTTSDEQRSAIFDYRDLRPGRCSLKFKSYNSHSSNHYFPCSRLRPQFRSLQIPRMIPLGPVQKCYLRISRKRLTPLSDNTLRWDFRHFDLFTMQRHGRVSLKSCEWKYYL